MPTRDVLGEVGLPAPVSELAARDWDVVVVGGGHNGLTAAAYLARGGHSVLVLERRARLGGACTLERPFPDPGWLVSPCAYSVGLLHPLVVDELGLHQRGYRVQLVDPHMWCPFEDGTSIALWDDPRRSAAAVAELAPGDVDGYRAYEDLFARVRAALRHGRRDTWVGDAPDRQEIEELLDGDGEAIDIVFETSIAEVVEHYVRDERLRTALHGQGIIGTNAGPRDPGTAGVHLMHASGSLEGRAGAWGYVDGGMGQVSFALADAALEAGAVLAAGVAVASVLPGEGVVLEGGETVRARAVVSNADPKRTVALCAHGVPGPFRRRVEGWRSESPVLKVNCGLNRLPHFPSARPGVDPHRAMVTISTGIDATQAAYEASRRGEPAPAWCELYFQSAYDPTVVPEGCHVMSVFAQYVPVALARGTWERRREEIGDAAIATIARFAPDVADAVVHREVLGPPDVEERIGLTGGHIFQGECLPDQMWHHRFGPRTPIPGVYLCGASTHPGGSVMAVNGRNAAMAVHHDLARNGEPAGTAAALGPGRGASYERRAVVVAGTRHAPHEGDSPSVGATRPGAGLAPRRIPTAAMVVVYLAALGAFVGIVAVRGGPSVGDAYGVTKPATALADGDLGAAATASVLPQPPGYALLTSPFVLVFRPLIGASEWCDGHVPPVTRLLLPWCKPAQLAGHRWYRSQAVLGILAWVVMALGAVRLLRVAGAGGGLAEVLLVVVLAAAPAASDGIVETFHPQDLVCVGLIGAGLAETLRRRWVATGVLFGVAFLCKQFAVLPLVAVLAAAPGWRPRARVVVPAVAVVGCGLLPFLAVDPRATWDTLSAVNTGGVVKLTTGTVVGMTSLSETSKLVIARDGPVVLALAMALWARWRAGGRLLSPVALIGLATACLAGRLVAEVWFASYYLLAVSVGLLVLDLAARRVPVWSFLWIALTGVLVEQAGGLPTTPLAAFLALGAALSAVLIALRAVPARPLSA